MESASAYLTANFNIPKDNLVPVDGQQTPASEQQDAAPVTKIKVDTETKIHQVPGDQLKVTPKLKVEKLDQQSIPKVHDAKDKIITKETPKEKIKKEASEIQPAKSQANEQAPVKAEEKPQEQLKPADATKELAPPTEKDSAPKGVE